MAKSRTKKAYISILTSGLYEIVVLISGLILPRLILQTFGSESNGLVSSISQFLSYITVLQLGVAGPTRVALYRSLSEGDLTKTSGIVNATGRYYKKISAIFLIYTAILAVSFPLIVNTRYSWIQVSALVIIIGIGTFAEYCFGITYSTLLTADQSGYIYTAIKIAGKILNIFVAVILIKQGASIFAVKLGSSLVFAGCPIILNLYVRKAYHLDRKAEPDYSGFDQRKAAASSTIANIVHEKTDFFLLTIFASSQTVSVYSVYMIVTSALTNLMKVFTGSLEAPFGDLWARGNKKSLLYNFSIYEFLIYGFACVIFSCCGLLLIPFITLYTAGITDTNYLMPAFAVLLTVTTAFFCVRQPYITLVQAAGKYEETKRGCYLEAALNFTISVILVQWFDLIGVTVGTLAANLFRTIHYAVFISKNMIDRRVRVVIGRLVWAVSTSAGIVLIARVIPHFLQYGTWLQWIASGCKCFVLACMLTLLTAFVFYRDDLKNSVGVIKRMVIKR